MAVEEAILGSIIKEPFLIDDLNLKPHHFVDSKNKAVVQGMNAIRQKGMKIDIVTLLTVQSPESYGGFEHLQTLERYANPKKFDQHVELLMDDWRNREKRNLLTTAASEDWEINKITSELDSLTDDKVDDHNDMVDLLSEVLEAPWIQSDKPKGVQTGLKGLQEATDGWKGNQLIIVAARPSMGKSDVMMHLAKEAGFDGRIPIIFSLEMSARSLRDRLIASVGFINRSKLRDPYSFLSEKQKKMWNAALAEVGKTNIHIFDKSGQTVSDMRLKTRKTMSRFKDKQPIIFIDYLTLIRSANFYNGNSHQQVGEITKALKAMSKEFDCPIICLAQLSRSVEQRQDKRPMLSDLRESGSVEEDADTVIFLYRDSYYSKDAADNSMEMIIGKQREGMVGTVTVNYNRFTGGITDEP